MRELAIVVLVLACPAALHAQSCEPGGVLMAGMAPGPVAVTMKAGERLKGTLICVDEDVVVLGDGARIRHLPFGDVQRIVKPRDALWNGIAIGAGIGYWAGSSAYGEAKYGGHREGPYVLSAILTMAALGALVDAMHGSGWTIYSAGPMNAAAGATVGLRVRF